MKIAIAQLNPTIGDLTGNANHILEAARQAADQGARLVLTPELSLCGYPPRDLLLQPSFVQAMQRTLEQLAQDLPPHLAVLVGTVTPNERSPQQGGKPLYNSSALLYNGYIQQVFHKRLLPTYDVFDEDRYFASAPANESFVLPICPDPHNPHAPTVRIGVTICEDLWNDELFWGKRSYGVNPLDELAAQSVDLIVNLSASPYSLNKQALREAMLRHGATRYQLPILYANQVGGNDDLIFDGTSVGVDRAGELVCRGHAFATDLVLVDFDLTRRDLVALEGAIAPPPPGEEAELWAALVLGLGDYVRKCGFSQVVLGLSGGIDSSLVAAIAVAALGPDRVLGVLMPSPYSSDHSIGDALDLAQRLGMPTHTLPIGNLMQTYDQTFADLFAGTPFGIAEENLQSRIRGNLLMALANKFGYLLISTGNKSEMAVGYCTLYGDMNGGLAAIADLPKTRVYSICQWLNRGSDRPDAPFPVAPIPESVLTKPPSAELKPGQVDQDSLPPYDELDDILERLILLHQSPTDIVAAGHAPAVVEKVLKLVSRAEFKRKQAPPGLKVTDRAFGTGWRMPIACRWQSATTATPQTGDSRPIVRASS